MSTNIRVFSATSRFIRLDGKVVGTIHGWWDAQMIHEGITWKSAVAEQLWNTFVDANRFTHPEWAPDRTLDIREGGVLYNLMHHRIGG